jgi:hypothetical protein
VLINLGLDGVAAELLFHLKLVPEQGMLVREHAGAAQLIERTILGGGHEPGAGVVGDPGAWPCFEGTQECLLRQLLGQPDIAHPPCERCDQVRRLDAPDCIDGAMDIRDRHGHR